MLGLLTGQNSVRFILATLSLLAKMAGLPQFEPVKRS